MMYKATWMSALALSAALGVAGAARADITGKVALEGAPPEAKEIDMSGVKECAAKHADPVYEETVVADDKGNLANVIVFIKADDPTALGGEPPKQPAVLDQTGCQYVPHVMSVTVGQDLLVKNSDGFLHNVHSLATVNPAFNFGQPNVDPGKKADPLKATETFRVKCDVHPWMSAYIGVFEHPFHAVTKEDGTYAIKGKLPDGDYTIVAWHEKLGETEQQVTVKDGKATSDFKVNAAAAAADPAKVPGAVEVRLASDTTGAAKDDCTVSESCCPSTNDAAKPTGAVVREQPTEQPKQGAEPQARAN
jgi:hypothetical protein